MVIKIVDYELPFGTHDLYDVLLDGDKIETLVTHDPGTVINWINTTEHINSCRLQRLIVGLDIEWCPEFMDGCDHSVATLQLCVGKSCLIFQILRAPNIPRRLREFLGDTDNTFVGVGIKNDIRKLREDYGLEVAKSRDLRSWAANELGRKELRNAGLKVLVKEVVGKEMDKPKSVTLSRWDNRVLTKPQVAYACVDAYLSFELGRRLSAWY